MLVVADLDEQRIYPSFFFQYFGNTPRLNTYDLILNTLVTGTITTSDFVDKLFEIEEKPQENFTTA